MEVIIGLIVLMVIAVSANSISNHQLRPRSRYEPLPKPPINITRVYRGEVGEAIHRFELQKKKDQSSK